MQEGAMAAGECLPAVVYEMCRRYGCNELTFFAVLFDKICCGGGRHMLERDFEFGEFIQKSRQDVLYEHALTVIRVFLFVAVIQMHFAVQEKWHSHILH